VIPVAAMIPLKIATGECCGPFYKAMIIDCRTVCPVTIGENGEIRKGTAIRGLILLTFSERTRSGYACLL